MKEEDQNTNKKEQVNPDNVTLGLIALGFTSVGAGIVGKMLDNPELMWGASIVAISSYAFSLIRMKKQGVI